MACLKMFNLDQMIGVVEEVYLLGGSKLKFLFRAFSLDVHAFTHFLPGDVYISSIHTEKQMRFEV